MISRDDVMPEKYTTGYQSVIAFGRISIIEDEEQARAAAIALGTKYAGPAMMEKTVDYVNADIKRMNVIRLDIEHMTGKEGMGLVKARRKQAE